jgi:hypothetical protein
MKTGMGLDGFVWFEGQIEDRADPLLIGRVRVRCLGFDAWGSDGEKDMPTATLPWAYPLLPLNSSQGSVRAPKEGTWVFGFFRDGQDAQDRVVVGTINTGYHKWLEDPSDKTETGGAGPLALIPSSAVDIAGGGSMRDIADAYKNELQATVSAGVGVLREGSATDFDGVVALGVDPRESPGETMGLDDLKNVQSQLKLLPAAELAALSPGLQNLAKAPTKALGDMVSKGLEIDGLGGISDVASAVTSLSIDMPNLSMDFGSFDNAADSLLAVGELGLGKIDQGMELIGGGIDMLGSIDAEALGNITDSLNPEALAALGEEGVKKITDLAGKIPGGIEGLADNVGGAIEDIGGSIGDKIGNIDASKLASAGLDMGVDMALANPQVQMALAKIAQVMGMLQKVIKMKEMADKILSKLSSV